jgi:hypothetical protein
MLSLSPNEVDDNVIPSFYTHTHREILFFVEERNHFSPDLQKIPKFFLHNPAHGMQLAIQ